MRAVLGEIPRTALGPIVSACLVAGLVDPPAAPSALDWLAEEKVLESSRLAGLALRLARENEWAMPAQVECNLQANQFDWAARATTVIQTSAPLLESLTGAQTGFVITKGPGIAQVSGGLLERPFSDLDIVVEEAEYRAAVGLAREMGYREGQENVQPWPILGWACREAVNLRSDGGGSVDIHHHLPPWIWAETLTPGDLLAQSRMTSVQSVEMPLASSVHNLLISALHIVSDHGLPGRSLMPWRDLAVLVRVCDSEEVVRVAKAHRLGGWLHWVLKSYPPGVVPDSLLAALSAEYAAIPHARRLRITVDNDWARRPLVGHLFRLPTWRALLFAAGMLVPSPLFLRLQYPGSARRYRNWWSQGLSGKRMAVAALTRPGPGQ